MASEKMGELFKESKRVGKALAREGTLFPLTSVVVGGIVASGHSIVSKVVGGGLVAVGTTIIMQDAVSRIVPTKGEENDIS